MLRLTPTPLIRLGNLFPGRQVYAKCEFTAPSGCFKIRGAIHLLSHLQGQGQPRELVVPSMGNTALGAAVGAAAFGWRMVGVVPATISAAKDQKLQALGVDLVKINGGGSELLRHATHLAEQRRGYFVHPHLDPQWTDGYRTIIQEILEQQPDCRTLVFPLGGGGLLMGLAAYLQEHPAPLRLIACEPYNYPKYGRFDHPRSRTIADGLLLEHPHAPVQQRIAAMGISVPLVPEADIAVAMRELYVHQALVVEPSSAVPVAWVRAHASEIEEPLVLVLTGENIAREDFYRLITQA